MFASARDAAGTGEETVPGDTVCDVLEAARGRFGDTFAAVLANSVIWRNGEPTDLSDQVSDDDEIAILPPVSGGMD